MAKRLILNEHARCQGILEYFKLKKNEFHRGDQFLISSDKTAKTITLIIQIGALEVGDAFAQRTILDRDITDTKAQIEGLQRKINMYASLQESQKAANEHHLRRAQEDIKPFFEKLERLESQVSDLQTTIDADREVRFVFPMELE